MKISYKYLANHVAIGDMTPERLGDILTFAGAEVEEISRFASGTNLVIGKILSRRFSEDGGIGGNVQNIVDDLKS